MSFLRQLLAALVALPKRLPHDLRPGTGEANPVRRSLLFHLHPPRVTLRALRPTTTFGLGIISLTLFAILCLSGAVLMLYYQPAAESAYQSVQDIEYAVFFGGTVRAMHRWAGHALVLCLLLHFGRVAFSGAWRRRELNWLIGLGLGALMLGLAFTGYLLPWDQLSFWAVRVSIGMLEQWGAPGRWAAQLLLGGEQITSATLLRFYALHVALLPAMLAGLLLLHIWRIRRDGGLAVESCSAPEPTLPAWPHLVLREASLALLVTALVLGAAMLWPAPLGAPPDPSTPANPEKAPWYFLAFQEMVSHSATAGALVFPLCMGLGLFLLPWLDREDAAVGRLGGHRRTRQAIVFSALGAASVLAVSTWLWNSSAAAGWREIFSPTACLLALSWCAFFVGGVVTGSSRAAVLGWLTVLLVALVGFAFVGFCRGPDWVFYWPWEAWPGGS